MVSAGTFAPGEARKKYVSPATPNAAMIAVPAISFRRDPNVSDGFVSYRLLGSRGSKEPQVQRILAPSYGAKSFFAQKITPGSRRSIWGQRGRPNLVWRVQPALSKAVSAGPYVGNIHGCHASPIPHQRVSALPHRRTAALQHRPSRIGRKDGDRTTAERHSNGLLMTSFSSLGEYLRSGSIRRFKPDKAGHDPYRHHWT